MSEYINDTGFSNVEDRKPISSEIEFCKKWIKAFVKERKSINTDHSSYSLKHAVENWCINYVSNGAFIQAAVDLGYRYKRFGPNACFNMLLPKRGSKLFHEAFDDRKDSVFTDCCDERKARIGFIRNKKLYKLIKRNFEIGRLCKIEPRLLLILEEAASQRNCAGYNRVITYIRLRRKIYPLVGMGSNNPLMQGSKNYDVVRSALDDLLPRDDDDKKID